MHSQFVEVGVKEGDDSLREWRGTIEVHGDVVRGDFNRAQAVSSLYFQIVNEIMHEQKRF